MRLSWPSASSSRSSSSHLMRAGGWCLAAFCGSVRLRRPVAWYTQAQAHAHALLQYTRRRGQSGPISPTTHSSRPGGAFWALRGRSPRGNGSRKSLLWVRRAAMSRKTGDEQPNRDALGQRRPAMPRPSDMVKVTHTWQRSGPPSREELQPAPEAA